MTCTSPCARDIDTNPALAGCAPARNLCLKVAADPEAPLAVAVTGPGGSGKTATLDVLAALYRHAGLPVTREPDRDGAVILVDDAQELDDASLEALREVATERAARLVVAYRPWPRPPALSTLGAVLGRMHPPVVLGHLPRAGVVDRLTLLLGSCPTDEVSAGIHRITGGLPLFVDSVAPLLRSGNPIQAVPPNLVEVLRHDLDRLSPAVRGLLLAAALGSAPDTEALAALLDVRSTELVDLVEAARATGLVAEDGQLIPLASRAILDMTPTLAVHAMQQRLAAIHLSRNGSLVPTARSLLDTGASGPRVAAVLEAAADEALPESPHQAAEFYAAAARAGAPAPRLAARRAQAAALTGDLDSALRLADQVLTDEQAPERDRAVLVAAAVLAQRGSLARSAELYRWLGVAGLGVHASVAVPALVGVGALEEAKGMLDAEAARNHPPTVRSAAAELMASGILGTLTGAPAGALSHLTRASALLEPSGPAVLLPDTPAALTALAALHCGAPDVAESVLQRAISVELGGPAAATRHRLLLAWVTTTRGGSVATRDLPSSGDPLEPRDELFAAALDVASARRRGDRAELAATWPRAREAVLRYPVDLYVLHPLGELAVAAARLGERGWLTTHLADAEALLDRLGRPAFWAASLHWFGVQAAIAAESPREANRHTAALVRASANPYAVALATGARSWLRVLAGDVEPDSVIAAARGLQSVGLPWEAAQLAGQAAIRTPDRKAMSTLLNCARALSQPTAEPATPAQAPPAAEPAGPLSDRELEVAELVVAGLTYKQVGERLFISAKTVEHHVARIRQRLGCTTRSELIEELRALLAARRPPDQD
ncbi:helix-turn-helix transcriptional regulator [Longimycelium tulufanense]|uniref:Helix-turn-helix transcriptional regulator n=1 Tax=Longimycelium tulufanense TaxID=907463 RepID=A0A8J3C5R3_9PSEU|nr:helix-turn-helix transcriptional regulator [Longimycelium tulufanense]GGM33945.1 helix-turn-helix transcriptional regulator [Longimycelium tulufanense]